MKMFPPPSRKPLACLAVVVTLMFVVLHRGLGLDNIGGGFHPGHVWVIDQVAQMMQGSESWSGWTQRIGYPEPVFLRLIAWVPLLVAAPVAMVFGAPAAMLFIIVVGLIASAWASAALIQRLTGSGWTASAGAALVYCMGPFALGVMANGQLAKMQLWCLPLVLLCSDKVLREGGRGLLVLGLFLASLAMGFTSPSVGLVAPAALAVLIVFRTLWLDAGAFRAFCVLAVVAVAMCVPFLMHTVEVSGTVGLLPAAPVPGLVAPESLAPVANIAGLFWGAGAWNPEHSAINNVAALGLPAVLALAVALTRPRPSVLLGFSLFLVGVLLALGPSQVWGENRWILPAYLLDIAGYPMQKSGMYYRFVQVAALGLALATASLASRWSKRGWVLAWAVGLLSFMDGVRGTEQIWPRQMKPVASYSLFESMAADPVRGAVLEFPLGHLDTEGERRLVAALIHQRSTTALARNTIVRGTPRLERLAAIIEGRNAEEVLAQAGFRYVLLHRPKEPASRSLRTKLESHLGSPSGDQNLALWVISPSTVKR
tara:strand:- start:343 stop:1965 length:1623 start_codon:yes stop_codon:yes gene_type:complete